MGREVFFDGRESAEAASGRSSADDAPREIARRDRRRRTDAAIDACLALARVYDAWRCGARYIFIDIVQGAEFAARESVGL